MFCHWMFGVVEMPSQHAILDLHHVGGHGPFPLLLLTRLIRFMQESSMNTRQRQRIGDRALLLLLIWSQSIHPSIHRINNQQDDA